MTSPTPTAPPPPPPPPSVGVEGPPMMKLPTNTSSSSARPARRKDQFTVLPPSTSSRFTPRSWRIPRSRSTSTWSSPHRTTSAFRNVFTQLVFVAINVGAVPSNTAAFTGEEPSESMTTRSGFGPRANSFFTVSFGSSIRTVPTPTRIASHAARSSWSRFRSSSFEIRTPSREGSAIFPSADIAAFTTTCGRTAAQRRPWLMNPLQNVLLAGVDGEGMAMRKSVVEMVTSTKFLATGYSGAKLLFHAPTEGETREGPSPFETVVLAAGGCTAVDVVEILQKQREPVEAFRVEVESQRAKGPPAVLEKLQLTYILRGPKKEANVQRAIELSMEKYCSVNIMLKRAGVEVTTSYRIEPA